MNYIKMWYQEYTLKVFSQI